MKKMEKMEKNSGETLPFPAALVLFSLRLLCYLSVLSLVYFHAGIPVSYDRHGMILLFGIIPFEALAGFLPGIKVFRKRLLLAGLPLIGYSIYYLGGIGFDLMSFLFTLFWLCLLGFSIFIITFLLFRHPRWGKLAVIEPFILAWVCLKLLNFSRSGEDASGQSMGITQFILVWTVLVFLLHSAAVYFCLYPRSVSGAKREAGILGLGGIGALVLVMFILPADFVRNEMVVNLLQEEAEEMTKPDDNDWGIPKDGGGRPHRGPIPGDKDGKQPGLRGLSEYDWPSGNSRGKGRGTKGRKGKGEGGQDQQFTVMVVASKQDVYMGDSFRGKLDSVQGFLPTPNEPLNRLSLMRLFDTWSDSARVPDRGRRRREVFSLSTLPQNFLPYRPVAMEPTILSEGSGPLRYIHRVFSDMYPGEPLELALAPIRGLSAAEKNALALYLEVPLEGLDQAVFTDHLERALDRWQANQSAIMQSIFDPGGSLNRDINANEYLGNILAILVSFGDYQYNVSDNDDFSIAALMEFLLNTKDGDCVEFSNTAALLGRLAGIPSRVVTGYLAADGLQTMAHRRGLAALRSKIKLLQDFPLEDLYLVTDAHSHSWVQFYVPDYGWLDFEATTFAIPPIGFGDGNLRDVVIPLIDERRVLAPVRSFPWRVVLRGMGILGITALVCAYGLRYGRETLLRLAARRGGRAGARFLYLLLLARLAADGNPIKPASKTAAEYARLFPDSGESSPFKAFADIYAELRWREFQDSAQRDERFLRLKEEYRHIINTTKRRGVLGFFKRIFSLRGLAYL